MTIALVAQILADTIEPEDSDGTTTAVIIGVILLAMVVAGVALWRLRRRRPTDRD